MSFDRFDMEQQIMRCWQVTDDINTVLEGSLDHEWTKDQTANALMGMREMYQLHFNKLWDMFSQGVGDRKIS